MGRLKERSRVILQPSRVLVLRVLTMLLGLLITILLPSTPAFAVGPTQTTTYDASPTTSEQGRPIASSDRAPIVTHVSSERFGTFIGDYPSPCRAAVAARAGGEGVDLFRHVSPGELADIQKSGVSGLVQYRWRASGLPSLRSMLSSGGTLSTAVEAQW